MTTAHQTQVLPALTQVVLDVEAAVNHLLRLNLSHSSISSLLRPQPVQSGPARSLTQSMMIMRTLMMVIKMILMITMLMRIKMIILMLKMMTAMMMMILYLTTDRTAWTDWTQ